MTFLRQILGGLVIIAVSGLIGIAQNTVRDDSIALVPTAARAIAQKESGGQPGIPKSTASDVDAESPSGWPTDEEFRSGEITAERFRELRAMADVIVIDARSPAEYESGRIAGAINVPYDELIEYYDYLKATVPLGALVVCYCESVTCDQSENLAKELALMGYANVLVYRGGWQEWNTTGYPVEGTSVTE